MRFRWPRCSSRWPSAWRWAPGCCPTPCCPVCATTSSELQNQINALTDEKNALNEKLSAAGEFDAQMSPRILRDALAGKSVVVFRTPDAADDDVDALSRMVGAGRRHGHRDGRR